MSTLICCDDPVFALYQKNPDMGPVDFLVLWIIEQKAQVNGRMSFAEIAKEAHVSVRTVGEVVRRHVGKCVTMVRNVGQTCIIRVLVPPRKKAPDPTAEPRKNLPDPQPQTLPPLSEGVLKALINLRVKEEVVVKAPATARHSIFSETTNAQILAVADKFYELRGIKQISPRMPEANLCLRIEGVVRDWGPEASLAMLLAHFQEMKQEKNPKNDTLDNAFPKARRDGKRYPAELDAVWAGQLVDRGLKIMADNERRKAEISRFEQQEPRARPSPERIQQVRAMWRQAIGVFG